MLGLKGLGLAHWSKGAIKVQLSIPDDWDGTTWECYLITFPKSIQWDAILRGLLSTPTRGRFWESQSGSILDAQAIGREIVERNVDMQCDDLINQLAALVTAIEGIQVSQSSQITVQTTVANNIQALAVSNASAIAGLEATLTAISTSQAISQAFAYAWAQSFAQQLAPTYVINNYAMQLRPIDPQIESAPTTDETTQTGVGNTLEDQSQSEMCKRVFWLIWNVRTIFFYVKYGIDFGKTGVLALLGLISDAVSAAGVSLLGSAAKRYMLPASALLQLTHLLAEMMADGSLFQFLDEAETAFTDHFDDLFLAIFCEAISESYTDVIQSEIKAFWANYLNVSNGIATMTLFFNLSVLATLYYQGTDLDPAPTIPTSYAYLCSLSCGNGG